MNEKQKEWIHFHSEGNARAAARYGLKGWREENGDAAREKVERERPRCEMQPTMPQKWAKF